MKKQSYKLTVIVKRANVEFAEGLGIGVLASHIVTYDLPDNFSQALLAMNLSDQQDKIVADTIEVTIEEVELG